MSSRNLHYIHFLKSPPSRVTLHQPFKIVLTITNDLTDEKWYDQVTLECKVCDSLGRVFDGLQLKDGSSTIAYNPFNGGFCSFEASFTKLPPCGTGMVTVMAQAITTAGSTPDDELALLKTTIKSTSLFIPVWTTAICVTKDKKHTLDSENQHQCERRLLLSGNRTLRILEDKQESIARHLWDSGVAMCCYLSSVSGQCNPTIRINHSSVVVELGSGTGLAGICASILFNPQMTILTDLDDALELLQSNTNLNSPTAAIEVRELDWSQCASVRTSLPDKIDVILLSDVLYNQDTHDILLETLDMLADENTQVLLAAKERHVDEQVFWKKIQGKWETRLLYQVLSCQVFELCKI